MFSVDYPTLRQIIDTYLYTGVFRAKVTLSYFQHREGYIELQVREGVIQTGKFVTLQGQVVKWEQWEAQIAQLGVLNWELVALSSAEPLPEEQTPASSASLPQLPAGEPKPSPVKLPCHARILSSSQLRQLSMPYRQVYSLIDGKRRDADIAVILHKSQQEIARIIDDLDQQGLIQIC